jgi:hypothetical protein
MYTTLIFDGLSVVYKQDRSRARPPSTNLRHCFWKITQDPIHEVVRYWMTNVNKAHSTPKDSYRTRQTNKNSSRCSIFGINGKIDPLSESDDFDEEVIYSQESPKMEEFFRDFDWDLDRFVEYRSPFTRKETLPIKKPLYFRF